MSYIIEQRIAQDIVTRMKNIIHQELNFFSMEGSIIASTDPTRIGQLNHDGAKQVLEQNKPLVIEYDNQYQGAKQGINLPVTIDNMMVGVIGITGKKEEVIQYGEIIKEMTEILLLNNTAKELVFNRRSVNQNILDYILNEDKEPEEGLSVEVLYGIKLEIPRIAIVGLPINQADSILDKDLSTLYMNLDVLLGNNQQNIFDIRGNIVTILVQSSNEEQACIIAKKIQELFQWNLHISMAFTVGTLQAGKDGLKTSINQAKSVLYWNRKDTNHPIKKYSELEYGIVLNNLSKQNTSYFLQKIFQNATNKEIQDMIVLLQAYEHCNGSIKDCAEYLYIHKNTVQYKLNKIHTVTGYNPRNLSDFFLLKLACILYQNR